MITRALRLLTALRLCLFRRRILRFSKGRSGRTLTLSFMVTPPGADPETTPLEVSYSNLPLAAAPKPCYFNGLQWESCQLKTALARLQKLELLVEKQFAWGSYLI